MDILDNLSSLPEWDDEGFRRIEQEEGDSRIPDAGLEACKALYNQWREVMTGIHGLFSYAQQSPDVPEDFFLGQKNMILSDAYQVAVKVRSSDSTGLYVLKMENAAVIRKNAMFIYGQIGSMEAMGFIEEAHSGAVRADLDQFRELFKVWVTTFEKDAYKDEWGFFV